MKKYFQGKFRPSNPSKYKGNPNNIIFRSSWEFRYLMYLDNSKEIIEYSSEEIVVPYRSPLDNRIHNYFVDFCVTRINKGQKETVLLELKPDKFTRPPVKKKRMTNKYISEVKTYLINDAKWQAAQTFAKTRGWSFHVLTERDLFAQ